MNVQTWDGKRFDIMSRDMAQELVDQGTHEISTGKNATSLLSHAKLQERGQAYKTREMKATATTASKKKATKNGTASKRKKPATVVPGVPDYNG